MSDNVIQTSFSAGELAPSILARTDLAKYHVGAAKMRNFFVDYRSGASTRPGTAYITQAYNSAEDVRLITYQFSNTSDYIIEFGSFYCRFIANGGLVLEPSFTISGMTNNNPAVLTVVGNNFGNGNWIFVEGITGVPQINGRYFIVSVSGNNVTLFDTHGAPVNSLSWPTYTGGGLAGRVYQIASPYAPTDLALLKFDQRTNVMTFTHPNYSPYTLTSFDPVNWVFAPIVYATNSAPPTGVSVATSSAGAVNYSFVVTSVDANGEESAPSAPGAVASAVNITTTPGTLTVTWTPAAGAVSYNVYQAQPSLAGAIPAGASYGFVGSSDSTTFINSNIAPDYSTTPPVIANPFAGGNNPSCSCFFQQRHVFAASLTQPETMWMSQPGLYDNFNVSDPAQADDAITATLVSLQVNAIKSMVPMPGGLIALTAKGAWQVSGGSPGAAVTPADITATPQAYNGASDLPPIVVNDNILYVQAKGAIVRNLVYNFYVNIYTGTDISVLSNHLFYGHQIVQWAYAEEPFKLVWLVRDDGILLSLTFVKEQEIYGFAEHDTFGQFLSVATITEGQVDATYVVVERFGSKFIERLADRTFEYGAEDAWSVDAGVMSPLVYPPSNLTATSSVGVVQFTSSLPAFGVSSVGQILRMDGGIATISQFVTPNVVIGTWTQVPTNVTRNDPNSIPVPALAGTWSITPQNTTFYGLDYLNGQTVSILADGGVVTPQVVQNGSITLLQPASKVIAGLKFTAQLQTMPLDVGEPTIQGKRKKINALTIRCADTRGLSAGSSFTTLTPIKEMNPSVILGQPIPLVTGDERIIMDPIWGVPGQICIQQSNPLPATVLGVIPEITVGDTK